MMHFGPYPYATRAARAIALEGAYAETQFPADAHKTVDCYLETSKAYRYPSIIFALRPEYAEYTRDSDMGAGHGVIYDGVVTLDMIDERSSKAIAEILAGIGDMTIPDSWIANSAPRLHQSVSAIA